MKAASVGAKNVTPSAGAGTAAGLVASSVFTICLQGDSRKVLLQHIKPNVLHEVHRCRDAPTHAPSALRQHNHHAASPNSHDKPARPTWVMIVRPGWFARIDWNDGNLQVCMARALE